MLLPRYRDEPETPRTLVEKLKQRDTHNHAITTIVQAGPSNNPADAALLRGIPCIANGVGGTSPGTDPLTQALKSDHRLRYGAAVR